MFVYPLYCISVYITNEYLAVVIEAVEVMLAKYDFRISNRQVWSVEIWGWGQAGYTG